MEKINNDTLSGLSKAIGIDGDMPQSLYKMAELDARYLKDLKINVTNALHFETLDSKESSLLALSVAINEKSQRLIDSFIQMSISNGATEAEISETYACVSLLNVNNVFYRFRHFNKKEYYTQTPAGIKMSIMGNPVLGKEFFELMSLVVSALNGCELCVNAHEESLIKLGTSQQRVYDAVRLAANIKGLSVFY